MQASTSTEGLPVSPIVRRSTDNGSNHTTTNHNTTQNNITTVPQKVEQAREAEEASGADGW